MLISTHAVSVVEKAGGKTEEAPDGGWTEEAPGGGRTEEAPDGGRTEEAPDGEETEEAAEGRTSEEAARGAVGEDAAGAVKSGGEGSGPGMGAEEGGPEQAVRAANATTRNDRRFTDTRAVSDQRSGDVNHGRRFRNRRCQSRATVPEPAMSITRGGSGTGSGDVFY
ncbi:hypothetical protein [Actinoplanes sp. NPDC023714]|uniref:hypothetical protein n=1 Tax=Actinoplanes sp. NPDC023714 TaxID=3154322 RepID=UPI0033C9C782